MRVANVGMQLHYFFPQIPQIAKMATIAVAASQANVFHWQTGHL